MSTDNLAGCAIFAIYLLVRESQRKPTVSSSREKSTSSCSRRPANVEPSLKKQQGSAASNQNVLMQHDAVVECACVAAPDPDGRRGAIVKAYVVVNDRHEAGEPLAADLQYFVKNNAAPYMYPRAISFEDVLPKTINGKILRSELRERARSEGEE